MDRVFTDKIESNGKPWPVDDGLVDKYRVFRSPIFQADDGQKAVLLDKPVFEILSSTGEIAYEATEEVDAFVFVLKPNHDHHARVAIAAYAASCAIEKPQLSAELYQLLSDDEWGSD